MKSWREFGGELEQSSDGRCIADDVAGEAAQPGDGTCAGRARRQAEGFTLIELLVVISIIAVLLSIMLPSLRSAKEQAEGVICMTHQRAILQAFMCYSQDYGECLPGVDGTTVGRFWWKVMEEYFDKRIPAKILDCTEENMPEILFCPCGKVPFPKLYMLGKIAITHYFLNGVEVGKAMGAGKKLGIGLFGGNGKITQPKTPSRCMMIGDTTHFNKIVDMDHPAAVKAFEDAGADQRYARIRYHHRATTGFFHRGAINIGFADGHVDALRGKRMDDEYANDPSQWPLPMRANPTLFYPKLSIPTAGEDPLFWGPPYDSYGSQRRQAAARSPRFFRDALGLEE